MTHEEEMMKSLETLLTSHHDEIGKGVDKAVENILQKGMQPNEALGFDKSQISDLYEEALQLYNSGKFKEANEVFASLAILDTSEPKYLLGLAACNQMLKEYAKAAETYVKCAFLSPEDPTPYFHAATCYMNLKQDISALVALQMALTRAGDKKEHAKLKEKAQIMMENIQK